MFVLCSLRRSFFFIIIHFFCVLFRWFLTYVSFSSFINFFSFNFFLWTNTRLCRSHDVCIHIMSVLDLFSFLLFDLWKVFIFFRSGITFCHFPLVSVVTHLKYFVDSLKNLLVRYCSEVFGCKGARNWSLTSSTNDWMQNDPSSSIICSTFFFIHHLNSSSSLNERSRKAQK